MIYVRLLVIGILVAFSGARPALTAPIDGQHLVRVADAAPTRIVTIRPDGRGRRVEHIVRGFDPAYDSLSPDGTAYATAGEDAIMITQVSTGMSRTLVTARPEHGFGGYDVDRPAWSPDGTRLAVTDWLLCQQQPSSAEPCVIWSVLVVDLGGNVTAEIGGVRNPSWSPSSAQLVAEADMNVYQEAETIAVVAADGQDGYALTPEYGIWYSPVWSPNGRMVAFTGSGENDDNDGLYVVRADGSTAPVKLGPWYSPVWAPNSKRLAFSRFHYWAKTDDLDAGTLFASRVDGGDRHRLTNPRASALRPIWSPNGTQVALSYDIGAGERLAIVAARGGKIRTLTPTGRTSVFPLGWVKGRITFALVS